MRTETLRSDRPARRHPRARPAARSRRAGGRPGGRVRAGARLRAALPAALALGVALTSSSTAAAQAPPPAAIGATPAPTTAAAPAPDAAAFDAFFDGAVPRGLAAHHVPGAVVSVVSGGTRRVAKGYGLADVERRVPFEPATSLVRIASISKLFTWTAVMQLVEQGRLDLHADVNRYLRTFHLPDTYPQPITLDHLMSHTAGFEDSAIGIGAHDKADVPPLAEYLADHVPARVRPPGEMSAYSNYGAALAGHIVAEVSGQPYEDYVRDHILEPLGMRHSTAGEPVPDDLAGELAASYQADDAADERVPFVYDKLVPDGSVSATATDMAQFMIAHLHDGLLGDHRILAEPTTRLMHERSFAPDPALSGWAHGFKERTFNGHRVLMHDGGWEGFQSALLLVPDRDLGLFVSMNGTGGGDALGDLVPAFFDRFLPAPEAPEARAGAGAPAGEIAGFYRPTRSSASTIEKLLTLTGSARARVDDDGTLHFGGRDWHPVAPRRYREVGGFEQLALVADHDGRLVYLATDRTAYEKLAWYETIPVNGVVLAAFALPALAALVGWPLVAGVRRLRRRSSRAALPLRSARVLAAAGCAVGLVFVVVLALMLLGGTSVLYGVPPGVRALLILPLVFVTLTAATAVATVAAWRRGAGGVAARVHLSVVLAGMVGLVWFLAQWNLLGWRFG
jgi:CubicO group peptidase (beta-lactamase class C family)